MCHSRILSPSKASGLPTLFPLHLPRAEMFALRRSDENEPVRRILPARSASRVQHRLLSPENIASSRLVAPGFPRMSTDQMVIELTKRTQTKHRKAKKGHGWTKLERIEMDCIWVNLKTVGPPFFIFMPVYIKISFTQRENHSQLLCGLDFATERLLLCQFDV